jgi:hypothetical protein
MSTLHRPEPVKLIIGVFTPHRERFGPVAGALADAYGVTDMISPWIPFDQTTYYADEMGGPLYRRLMAFAEPMDPGRLPSVKHFCHDLEQAGLDGHRRRVNIDPGYLCRSRVVLATGKDFTHRIYIGASVYADLTLVFQGGRFTALPWTYPDYRTPPLLRFLEKARIKYITDAAGARPSALGSQSDEEDS